jgi:protease-4
MSLDPDVVIDRRRLRRKLTLWRVLAFVAIAVALIVGGLWAAGVDGDFDKRSPHIARVSINGFIAPTRAQIEMLDKIKTSDAVKGVIVSIDSTGGATTGGEALHQAIREIAAKKPVVAAIDTVGASAAYMIAVGADHVIARRSAIVGSIGVIVQWPDASKLLDTLGVKYEEVKSTPMKAEPMPFKPASPEAKAMIDRLVQDSYRWFVELVATRRGIPVDRMRELADGRIVTGAQALELKLIDALGDEATAKDWLVKEKGVSKDLKIKSWTTRAADVEDWGLAHAFARGLIDAAADRLGLPASTGPAPKLDGLLSVWHFPGSDTMKKVEGARP